MFIFVFHSGSLSVDMWGIMHTLCVKRKSQQTPEDNDRDDNIWCRFPWRPALNVCAVNTRHCGCFSLPHPSPVAERDSKGHTARSLPLASPDG